MAKSTAFAGALLNLIFNKVDIPGLGDDLYIAAHTADPGVGGAQNTSEADYPGYARVAFARDAAWLITGNEASPVAPFTFPAATGSGADITHYSVGVAATGAGMVFYSAPLVNGAGDPLPKPITEGDSPVVAETSVIGET